MKKKKKIKGGGFGTRRKVSKHQGEGNMTGLGCLKRKSRSKEEKGKK